MNRRSKELEAAHEAAVNMLSLGGKANTVTIKTEDLIEIMVDALRDSPLTDADLDDLSNRIGRIPHERARRESRG